MSIILYNKTNINNDLINYINNFILQNFNDSRIDDYTYLICYYDNYMNIIGFVGLYFVDNILLINQLCVNINNRNKGIAKKIINFIFENFKNIILGLYIDKNKPNTAFLYNFYIKLGFNDITNDFFKTTSLQFFQDIEYLLIK